MKFRTFIETKTQVTCMAVVLGVATQAFAQTLPSNLPTKEQLANDNNLFIALAKKALKWEEPAEPAKIVGPIYFVGTKGLGVFLFTTSEGHILMNTGMPSSGPMIVESIRKLGFRPEDIKLMINGHAHIDHAGAFAFLKQQFGAQLAVMKDDVAAMESGDKRRLQVRQRLRLPARQGRSHPARRRHDQDGRRAAHRLSHAGPHARSDHLDRKPRRSTARPMWSLSPTAPGSIRATGW